MERNPPRVSDTSLPPWLWFWLVVYALSLPRVVQGLRQQLLNVLSLFETLPTAELAAAILALHAYFLSALPQLLSTLAFVLGFFTVLVPWFRAAYLEWRFRLKEIAAALPALEEIKDFVHEHAPDIKIKVNLIRTDQLVFVYPLGFRRSALAVFGGLVKLWRSERQAAEAVLLHEIGHHRQGDILIAGAGSFLEPFVSRIPMIAAVLMVIDGAAISVYMADRLGHAVLPTLVGFVLWVVPMMVLLFIAVLIWTSASILPLMAAFWCSELNADRFAIGAQRRSEDLTGALGKLAPHKSWWRWFVFRMSHPPQRLRRWAARRSAKTLTLTTLLLIFPLAYVARMATMSGWAMSLYLSQCIFGCDLADVWKDLSANVGFILDRYTRMWLAMAGLLLLWPVLSKYWEGMFTNKPGRRFASQPRSYRAYALSATLVCVLALSFYLLRLPG